MSFYAGLVEGFNTRRRTEEDLNRKEVLANRDTEGKIAQRLLDDDDPQLQEIGLGILERSMAPPQKKGGFGGFMGQFRPSEAVRPLLDYARTLRGAPGKLQETPPQEGSAALPATSPTQPTRQPSMLDRAVRGGGGPPFGAPAPAAAVGGDVRPPLFGGNPETTPEVPGMQSFGGIQFEPSISTPAAAVPTVNVAAIASRVSRDGGQPQPGEKARLFYPSAARQYAQRQKAEIQVIAEQLQSLGATPLETKRAIMAKMGASGGQPNVTQAGYAKLADGTTVQTFTYEEPGVPPRLVYNGPNGFQPVPPDAQATRMAGVGAGGSQTSRMTGQQAIEAGLVEPDEVDPEQYYSVKIQGDTLSILPATAPSQPFGFQAGTGSPFAPGRDRQGNPITLPSPTPNPQVSAAKALAQALGAIPSTMRLTGPQRQRAFQTELLKFPALRGLTEGQITALAQADDYLPPDKAEALLRGVGGPARPQSGLQPPPGVDPNQLPDDWAEKLSAEIIKGRKPQ